MGQRKVMRFPLLRVRSRIRMGIGLIEDSSSLIETSMRKLNLASDTRVVVLSWNFSSNS